MTRTAILALFLFVACKGTPVVKPDPVVAAKAAPAAKAPVEAEPAPFAPPALENVVKLYDASTGERLTLDALLDALAQREVVFFGETHLDESTHRLELAVYEGLIDRTGGKVVLAMEMFERDVQPALDSYLAGEIDEMHFLHRARVWSNYRTGYRALVETAKRRGLPVVASNAPAALRRKVGFGGPEALDKLPPEERQLLPDQLYPNTDAYWARFERVVRGHMDMIAGATPERRLTSGQSLWDNTMGDSCVQALTRYPDHVVLHVNGGFHSQFREGAVTQLLARRPDTRVAVLETRPVDDLPGVAAWKDPARADYLAAVDARARGLSEGFHGVTVATELRYRVMLPRDASDAKPAPLLIWLGDDPFRAQDGLVQWRTALGDEAALVVIEPPYPHTADDLYVAGRWFWSETFNEDLGMLGAGVARVAAYVLRNYPIDRARVVIAGEGTGATVVAAASLYAGGLEFAKLAVAPRRYQGLHGMALPGPRENAPQLTVLTRDRAWWDREAAEHERVGRKTDVVDAPDADWDVFVEAERRIRAGLGLAERPAASGDAKVLVLGVETPRARMWAHLMARRLEAKGEAAAVAAAGAEGVPLACLGEGDADTFGPAIMQDGGNLPFAAGPFGGTTILYVPRGRTDEQRAAWEELETKDVLHQRNRFAHVMVVFEGDEEDNLAAALQAIKDKGRSTVLVVPAVFCATGADMRRWASESEAYEDAMSIAWLPGLGGTVRLP